jgi:hypothetical protein
MLAITKPDLSDLFEEWLFVPTDALKRERIFPNQIAYHSDRQIVVLILRQSARGGDFAMNVAGLNYLLEVSQRGKLRNGKSMSGGAFVAFVAADNEAKQAGAVKVVGTKTVDEAFELIRGITPRDGSEGTNYWWLALDGERGDEADGLM